MNKTPTRVLVVEGDEDDASLLASYLACAPGSDDNLVLVHAPRLSTACHLLARQNFDVALLDLALPQTTGLEGLLKINAMRPALPIIILTGQKDEALAVRAVKLGAQDYFIKGSPDCGLLKRAIRYAIDKKRLSSGIEDFLAVDAVPRLVLDSEHIVRFANSAVEAVLGRGPGELMDKPFGHALPADDTELLLTSAWTRDRRVTARVNPIAWHGEPARLVSLLDAAPAPDQGAPQDEPDGDLSVMEAKNHFLSRISHELRNTLATMKTALYCLKESPEDGLSAQQTQMVDMIDRNIDRQTRIVENILDLARFRSGKLKIRFRQADAATIIADLAEEHRLSRGAQMLQVRVDAGLPSISCDPDLIAQVLRNLLDNAARYAKEKISIEAAAAGPDRIAISVTDDGAGIPEEHLNGLFTHFQRLDWPENGSSHKGTGLGLAICREIVEGHHGRIRAENAAGLGARFSFELPVRHVPGKTAPPSRRALGAAGGHKPSSPGKRSYLLHK